MQDLHEYHEKNKSKKLVKHQDFYIFVRNKLNILKNSKTYDMENRKQNTIWNKYSISSKNSKEQICNKCYKICHCFPFDVVVFLKNCM